MVGQLFAAPIAAGSYACSSIYPLDRAVRRERAIATYDSIPIYSRIYAPVLTFTFSRPLFCPQHLDRHRGRGRMVTERRRCSRKRSYPIYDATRPICSHRSDQFQGEVSKQQRVQYRLLE
ncbi:hypothetical protein OG21DRAFT_1510306 [Imleria badia]|nr:hypothetical protein OG21DRAFT_1510306 [Imleria badia]